MVTVEFKSVRKGTCQWRRRDQDEVFDVAFGDKSFIGPLCRNDLFRAIGMKLPMEPKPDQKPVPTMPAGTTVAAK